jgi:hypothetical protein
MARNWNLRTFLREYGAPILIVVVWSLGIAAWVWLWH